MNRYRKFIPAVLAIATMSKDRSTRVGAIALGPGNEIRSTGYNGFPRGIDDNIDERHKRPTKYMWTSHAEENLVAQAARSGVSLAGCTVLVSTLYPCSMCSRMMIQAGIKQIIAVAQRPNVVEKWDHESKVSREMLEEAGVEIHELKEATYDNT